MRLISGVALAAVLAGGAIIVLGFILGLSENRLRKGVKDGLDKANETVKDLKGQPIVAGGFDPAEYAKQLAEFAKALAGLSQASQAFLIATLLFAFSVALAIADRVAP